MSFYKNHRWLNMLRTKPAFVLSIFAFTMISHAVYSADRSSTTVSDFVMYFISCSTGLAVSMLGVMLLHIDTTSIGKISIKSKTAFKKSVLTGAYVTVFSGALLYFLFNGLSGSSVPSHLLWMGVSLGPLIGLVAGNISYKIYLGAEYKQE